MFEISLLLLPVLAAISVLLDVFALLAIPDWLTLLSVSPQFVISVSAVIAMLIL